MIYVYSHNALWQVNANRDTILLSMFMREWSATLRLVKATLTLGNVFPTATVRNSNVTKLTTKFIKCPYCNALQEAAEKRLFGLPDFVYDLIGPLLVPLLSSILQSLPGNGKHISSELLLLIDDIRERVVQKLTVTRVSRRRMNVWINIKCKYCNLTYEYNAYCDEARRK